jgi:AraC-like ligand binding domain
VWASGSFLGAFSVTRQGHGQWLKQTGGERLVTGWHWHDVHEIEYACRGMVEVKTQAGHYLLPPHQAAWIPAGLVT